MKQTWRRKQRSHSSIWRSVIPNIPSAALFLENSAASPMMHVLKTRNWKVAAASRVVTVVLSTRQSDLFFCTCQVIAVPGCHRVHGAVHGPWRCWGWGLSWRVGLLGEHDQVSQTASMLCTGSDCDVDTVQPELQGACRKCCKPAIQLAEHAPKTARLPRHTWTWGEVCHVVRLSNHGLEGNLMWQMWQVATNLSSRPVRAKTFRVHLVHLRALRALRAWTNRSPWCLVHPVPHKST